MTTQFDPHRKSETGDSPKGALPHEASCEQLRLLKRSIEATSNGVVIAEAHDDQPIIYVNPAFERITGYTAAEALGRNCRFLQGQEHHQPAVQELRAAIAGRHQVQVIIRNFRKDGTPFWNEIFIEPVPNDSGLVTHFIGILNDISRQRAAESQLAYNASHDVLTGLPNRSLLQDRLGQACQVARRHRRLLAVLYLDLDGFKPVNDSLGHLVGDRVLVEVAQRLEQSVRAGDTVARIGGDEFIVLLQDLSHGEDAVQVVETLVQRIGSTYQVEDHHLQLTASIGITASDGHEQDPMALIQQADLAMFRAKQKGHNTYEWYSSELNLEASKRVVLRNELQQAIERQDLVLHFQPMIDSRSGKVYTSEALVRWQHPERGLIPPLDFIPLAEETGQIITLGRWVLEQACQSGQALHHMGFEDHCVSVNVSPIQLRQANFVETVAQVLENTGLKPACLDIEIVESVLLEGTEQVIEVLRQLRALGVGVVIDDFGTGFSSLSYLKMLPAHKLKIDRAFIKDITQSNSDASITRGVISIAHHLSLTVVAEGVENTDQATLLHHYGCDQLQGYLFSRPVPLDELQAFVSARNTPLGKT